MTYIENIFLCLALPMLLSLLFTAGSSRRFTLFVVLGMFFCLLSAYVNSFFHGAASGGSGDDRHRDHPPSARRS